MIVHTKHTGCKLLIMDGKQGGKVMRNIQTVDRQWQSISVQQYWTWMGIIQDKRFKKSGKQLWQSSKGGHPNKALGLTSDELEKPWMEKQLGDHSPDALPHMVWLNGTMHFDWRARDKHRKVFLGDLELRQEEGGERREYIIWKTERGSKTRTGGKEIGAERYFSPQIYATGGEWCSVWLFKHFLARRPPDMMKVNDPLYLASMKNPKGDIWYKCQSLGVHSLGQFMKTMADTMRNPFLLTGNFHFTRYFRLLYCLRFVRFRLQFHLTFYIFKLKAKV